MIHNYVIAIGGTGARCLEAFVYAAAAGLTGRRPFNLLLIDADQNNGNGTKTNQLIGNYNELHRLAQPSSPRRRRALALRRHELSPPVAFQSRFNAGQNSDTRWKNPNNADLSFGQLIQYADQAREVRSFLDLFYTPGDLNMPLREGYVGKPNVGSVALKLSLQGSIVPGSSLYNFLQRLNSDLQGGEARVFVFGSVFGGTGAAGLPTVPSLINNLPENGVIARDNRERLRYGCAMIGPYFSFPRDENGLASGPGTDSAKHAIATQAALLHYAQTPPNYQHVYLVGAPARTQTNQRNVRGGEDQTNAPHYAELIAALAAIDFFSIREGDIDLAARELHYADTLLKQREEDRGVDWDTLPVSPFRAHERADIKASLLSFTTFAYLYQHLLHDRFVNYREYRQANWYVRNFAQLPLDDQTEQLGQLYRFVSSYNMWLREMGETCQPTGAEPRLFNWNALGDGHSDAARRLNLGSLLAASGANPKYMSAGWDKINDILNNITLAEPLPDSAAGLLIYLLYEASAQYCRENYLLRG
jgi:hypothetical protein